MLNRTVEVKKQTTRATTPQTFVKSRSGERFRFIQNKRGNEVMETAKNDIENSGIGKCFSTKLKFENSREILISSAGSSHLNER